MQPQTKKAKAATSSAVLTLVACATDDVDLCGPDVFGWLGKFFTHYSRSMGTGPCLGGERGAASPSTMKELVRPRNAKSERIVKDGAAADSKGKDGVRLINFVDDSDEDHDDDFDSEYMPRKGYGFVIFFLYAILLPSPSIYYFLRDRAAHKEHKRKRRLAKAAGMPGMSTPGTNNPRALNPSFDDEEDLPRDLSSYTDFDNPLSKIQSSGTQPRIQRIQRK